MRECSLVVKAEGKWVLVRRAKICRGDPPWSPEQKGKHRGLPLRSSENVLPVDEG